jgi:hypothetical protein
LAYWYDWNDDLYPIHELPRWASKRVLRWLRRRDILPQVVPDLAAAAAEAFDQCRSTWEPGRAPFEAYAGTAMEHRMAQRLDELQIGAQSSRNAKVPNHTYSTAKSPTALGSLERGLKSTQRDQPAGSTTTADQERNLRAVARSWQRDRATPERQQDRYLERMHYGDAMRSLRADDPFAARVVFAVLHEGYSLSETAKMLRRRKTDVLAAFDYGKRFVGARLRVEDADSALARLRTAWRAEGYEPDWQGATLVFPIPMEADEDD